MNNMRYQNRTNTSVINDMLAMKRQALMHAMPTEICLTLPHNQTAEDRWEEDTVYIEITDTDKADYLSLYAEALLSIPEHNPVRNRTRVDLSNYLPLSDSCIRILEKSAFLSTEVQQIYQQAVDILYRDVYQSCIENGGAYAYFKESGSILDRAYEELSQDAYNYSFG